MLFPTVKHSPAIDTVADSIFYVATDGGAYISDYISTYSYGLRTRLVPIVLGPLNLLVILMVETFSVLIIPTEICSPFTDRSNGAYFVWPDGDVVPGGGDVYSDSYGLFYHHSYIYTNCKKGAMKYETT